MRPAGSLQLAGAIGAGLVTGLLHFPDPLAVTIAVIAGAWVAGGTPRRALAVAVVLGVLAGAQLRHADAQRCAARLPLGEREVRLLLIDPGESTGRVVPRFEGCLGVVTARWPTGVDLPAGVTATVRARWVPRRDPLGRAGGTLLVRQVEATRGRPGPIARSRTWASRTIRRRFGQDAPIVEALLIGRRGGLDADLRGRFAAAGMVHLLAISGFHVGLLAGWVVLLLAVVRVPRRHAEWCGAIIAVGYAGWLGWPAPATRAAALLAVLVLSRRRQRGVRFDGVIGASAVVVLLLDPWSIGSVGAWLSFAAVAGIAHATRWAARAWPDRRSSREALVASVAATIATAPIAVLAIGRVAPIGPLVNLLAIPLVAAAIPALLGTLFLAGPLPGAADGFAASAHVLLAALDRLATLAAALPGAAGEANPGWQAATPWLALLAIAIWATHRHTSPVEAMRRGGWGFAVLLWAPLLIGRAPRGTGTDRLALHFLDVGQGDAIAIRTPGGHWVVVDAGPGDSRTDAGRRVVVPFLRRAGADRVSVQVISHAHRDHVGGAATVASALPVGVAVDPAEPFEEAGYFAWLDTLAARGVRWHRAGRGERWTLDGVTFRVLHPDPRWPGWGRDLNEDSIVLEVRYGDFRALLAGDAGFAAESAYATGLGRVEVLKVGHHGSRGATGEALLAAIRPLAAVVSSGRNNYGHPAPATLARLGAAGATVWRTDREGTVSVETDGRTVRVHGGRHDATFDAHDPTDEDDPCCIRPR